MASASIARSPALPKLARSGTRVQSTPSVEVQMTASHGSSSKLASAQHGEADPTATKPGSPATTSRGHAPPKPAVGGDGISLTVQVGRSLFALADGTGGSVDVTALGAGGAVGAFGAMLGADGTVKVGAGEAQPARAIATSAGIGRRRGNQRVHTPGLRS